MIILFFFIVRCHGHWTWKSSRNSDKTLLNGWKSGMLWEWFKEIKHLNCTTSNLNTYLSCSMAHIRLCDFNLFSKFRNFFSSPQNCLVVIYSNAEWVNKWMIEWLFKWKFMKNPCGCGCGCGLADGRNMFNNSPLKLFDQCSCSLCCGLERQQFCINCGWFYLSSG